MNENTTEVLWKYRPIIKEKLKRKMTEERFLNSFFRFAFRDLNPMKKLLKI